MYLHAEMVTVYVNNMYILVLYCKYAYYLHKLNVMFILMTLCKKNKTLISKPMLFLKSQMLAPEPLSNM